LGKDGLPARRANDSMSAGAIGRYVARVGSYLDRLYDQAVERGYGEPLIAVEMPTPPKGYRTIPLRAWLVTTAVAWAVVGRYDGVHLVAPGRHGVRHQKARGGDGDMRAAYPEQLVRKRPGGWLPCEAPRQARDHERAAYDVAGVVLSAHHRTTGALS